MTLQLSISARNWLRRSLNPTNTRPFLATYFTPIRALDSRKDYAEGKVDTLFTESLDRGEAACEHFGRCGGCSEVFFSYEIVYVPFVNIYSLAKMMGR
jgi:hypothetical protein